MVAKMQSWWMLMTETDTALELRESPVPEPGPALAAGNLSSSMYIVLSAATALLPFGKMTTVAYVPAAPAATKKLRRESGEESAALRPS